MQDGEQRSQMLAASRAWIQLRCYVSLCNTQILITVYCIYGAEGPYNVLEGISWFVQCGGAYPEVREERARVASASCACCVDMCTMCQHAQSVDACA